MGAHGNNSSVHFIRDGSFVCTADPSAKCRNYPACECEESGGTAHEDPVADGHQDVPQSECWVQSWMDAVDLSDSYADGGTELCIGNDEFPDGPVEIEWHMDFLTWQYADDTNPRRTSEEF